LIEIQNKQYKHHVVGEITDGRYGCCCVASRYVALPIADELQCHAFLGLQREGRVGEMQMTAQEEADTMMAAMEAEKEEVPIRTRRREK
jgi:hypothetical protein